MANIIRSSFVLLLVLLGHMTMCTTLKMTWLGFGERQPDDEIIVVDYRETDSTKFLSYKIHFDYEDFYFTFANLSLSDNFDKIVHNYNDNVSKTQINFINVTSSKVNMTIYGLPARNIGTTTKLPKTTTQRPTTTTQLPTTTTQLPTTTTTTQLPTTTQFETTTTKIPTTLQKRSFGLKKFGKRIFDHSHLQQIY